MAKKLEIEEMRALVAAADAEQAEADRLGRIEYMNPLVELTGSTEFQFVRDKLAELAAIYRGDDYPAQTVANTGFGLSWMLDVSRMDLAKPEMPDVVVPEPVTPIVVTPPAEPVAE